MSRLYNLLNAPEPPEGFVWLIPGDGSNPVIVNDHTLTEDATLELLWSDTLTDKDLHLLVTHGNDTLSVAANNALTARILKGTNNDT